MSRCLAAALFLLVFNSLLPSATKSKIILPAVYSRWLNEEVNYIVTSAEKKEFVALATDAERDHFIENFWSIRNPNRNSRQNAYKDEHYKRLLYANEHFGRQSNTPGWNTDMGRSYILFGAPQSRGQYRGYGGLYPVELWFYSNDTGSPALPPFFTLMFFIPEDVGEYRFYRPSLDGPLKLVHGSHFQTNRDVYKFLLPISGELAHAAFSLIPNDPIDKTEFAPDLSSDLMISRIQNYANDPFNLRKLREMAALRASVNSVFLVDEDRPLDVQTIVVTDPLGNQWLDYGIAVSSERLGRRDPDGKQLHVSVAYSLSTDKGKLIVEDSEERSYPAFQELDGQKQFVPFVLANRLPIVPGKYRFEARILNSETSKISKAERKLDVERGEQISLSGPILATAVEQVAKPDAFTPFQYFGVQFHPAGAHRVNTQSPLRVLVELDAPAKGPEGYEIEWLLASVQNREARHSVTDPIAAAAFNNGHLLQSKSIPLAGLEEGEYRLVVNVHSAGSPATLASITAPVSIGNGTAAAEISFLSHARNLAAPGVAAYIRALEAIAQGNEAAGADYMSRAVEQNPANNFASNFLVQFYYRQKNYLPITKLYDRLGLTAFQSSPQSLAQITMSYWQSGNQAQAREVLAAAKSQYPDNAMILAMGRVVQKPR